MRRRRSIWRTLVIGRCDEGGYAAILAALFAAGLLIPLCAISVDVARWYVAIAQVQNAADAAATAGVTWLPDDFTSATSTATNVAADNGFASSATTRISTAIGSKPTQLVVTISTQVSNTFASAIGIPTTTITRTATADYNGPAPMGSPCNAFGNEPPGSATGVSDPRGPSSSVIVTPGGGASCTSTPQFWAAIAGPDTPKANGDQYMTRTCGANTDGCASSLSGAANNDFSPQGYFYAIRVGTAALNQPVTIQIYDPSWVATGDLCDKGPTVTNGIALANAMNSYVTSDGMTRYAMTTNSFCTGDVDNGTSAPIVTSFGLRSPTDTYQPTNGAPMPSCEKQYPGYMQNSASPNAVSTGTLASRTTTGANPNYNDKLAQVFHQWVDFCTFTPTQIGDYYLQVRTNVALGGTTDGVGGYGGNARVFDQTGDDASVHGTGNNRFSLRIKGSSTVEGGVSVSGWQNMSIYANYPANTGTVFNLVRVIPAAQSKTLKIHLFDVGDSAGTGTVTVLPPTDAKTNGTTMSYFSGCTGAGVVNGSLGSSCQLTNVTNATYNGRLQGISVPIPSAYTCNSTQAGGCWVRLQMQFTSTVNDTTTWSASIDGDPVRLIK